MKQLIKGSSVLILLALSACIPKDEPAESTLATDTLVAPKETVYLQAKAKFKTDLIKQGSAPQPSDELVDGKSHKVITYPSNGLNLKAILATEHIDTSKRKPVLVYLHGGFALGEGDLADCESFRKEGYIVLAPSYRGENGNDGIFELMYGEVDDAKAAVQWISKQKYVDTNQIYVFGHSIGGGISAMLALQKEVPMRLSGSCGGLYDRFVGWEDTVPFNLQNPIETIMRTPLRHVKSMLYEHYAFLGTEDGNSSAVKKPELYKGTKLHINYVPGDHFESLRPAIEKFLEIINQQKK
jgi:hypothetical protein